MIHLAKRTASGTTLSPPRSVAERTVMRSVAEGRGWGFATLRDELRRLRDAVATSWELAAATSPSDKSLPKFAGQVLTLWDSALAVIQEDVESRDMASRLIVEAGIVTNIIGEPSFERRALVLLREPPRDERGRLLGLLAQRVEQLSRRIRPYRRVSWAVVEASLGRRRHPREVAGIVPIWMLAAADRAGFGFGQGKRTVRARTMAPRRLADALTVEGAFERLGDGLRREEIAAATGIDEARLWRFLAWAKRHRVLLDRGELGWCRPGDGL